MLSEDGPPAVAAKSVEKEAAICEAEGFAPISFSREMSIESSMLAIKLISYSFAGDHDRPWRQDRQPAYRHFSGFLEVASMGCRLHFGEGPSYLAKGPGAADVKDYNEGPPILP